MLPRTLLWLAKTEKSSLKRLTKINLWFTIRKLDFLNDVLVLGTIYSYFWKIKLFKRSIFQYQLTLYFSYLFLALFVGSLFGSKFRVYANRQAADFANYFCRSAAEWRSLTLHPNFQKSNFLNKIGIFLQFKRMFYDQSYFSVTVIDVQLRKHSW